MAIFKSKLDSVKFKNSRKSKKRQLKVLNGDRSDKYWKFWEIYKSLSQEEKQKVIGAIVLMLITNH